MRKLEFVEPNFICDVSDSQQSVYKKWLFRFNTQAELEAHLKEKTYKIVSVAVYDFQNDWKQRANTATTAANKAKNEKGFEYDNALWTELKQYLFFISKGKCGYCEQKVTGVYAGDVEHYRPKKKVTDDPAHPGYYWLAYDEQNYVPVCQNCNGARAKANHFPLDPNSVRAALPGANLTLEKPLLINPLGKDDPTTHFEFIGPEGGDDFGKLTGTTDAGKKSCEIYHLNRGDLIEARRDAYKEMTDNKDLLEADWEKSVSERLMSQYKMGIKQFTLVIKAVLHDWLEEIRQKEQQSNAEQMKELQEKIKQIQLRQKNLEDRIANDLSMLQAGG